MSDYSTPGGGCRNIRQHKPSNYVGMFDNCRNIRQHKPSTIDIMLHRVLDYSTYVVLFDKHKPSNYVVFFDLSDYTT